MPGSGKGRRWSRPRKGRTEEVHSSPGRSWWRFPVPADPLQTGNVPPAPSSLLSAGRCPGPPSAGCSPHLPRSGRRTCRPLPPGQINRPAALPLLFSPLWRRCLSCIPVSEGSRSACPESGKPVFLSCLFPFLPHSFLSGLQLLFGYFKESMQT